MAHCLIVTSYKLDYTYPKAYMYGIYTYIYHKIQPNVGKYTILGTWMVWATIKSPKSLNKVI